MLDQYAFRNAKILRSQGKSYESGWQVFQQDDKQFTVSTARVAYVSTEQLPDWINQTRNWNPSYSASHRHPAYSDTEPTFACSLSTRPLSPLSLTPQWNILRRGCKEHHHFLNCFWKPGNAGIIKMQLSCWNELPKHRCKNQVHDVNDLTEKQQDTYFQVSRALLHLLGHQTSEQSWHKPYRRQLYSAKTTVDELSISKDNSTNHLCKQNSNQINCWPHANS